MNAENSWSLDSWRCKPAQQLSEYEDEEALNKVLSSLNSLPALVSSREIESVLSQLGECCSGSRFAIILGDCAEVFSEATEDKIRNKHKMIVKCAQILEKILKKPVLKIGRIAGQYAKPRSSPFETINGRQVNSFKGDIINGTGIDDRKPDPERLIKAYYHSATTINYLRVLREDSEKEPSDEKSIIQDAQVFTSHEGLLLNYEQALTRYQLNQNYYYNSSAHFIWIGERTRQIDHGHIEYFRGIRNPIGVKVGPTTSEADLAAILRVLNPSKTPGRLSLILRLGEKNVESVLPRIIKVKQTEGVPATWIVDPMHGNTYSVNGTKTRSFDHIYSEVIKTASLLKAEGEVLGGMMLESSADLVTECVGGVSSAISVENLQENYTTACDPRLNFTQTTDLLERVGDKL